ncbi:MAG: hypothetical protein JEZ09_18030 [Salinivirgaceae bacterium]|nr:hypothetical protein [Salinivirgaceae bacterium]
MKVLHFKRYLLVLSILFAMLSCTTLRVNKSSKPMAEDNLSYHAKFMHIDSNNVKTFECDNFVFNAINNYSIASIRQGYKFLKCTQEPIANMHYPSIIDTVFVFSNNKNIIKAYKAQLKSFIFIVDLTNAKFKLVGAVKPGMSKDAFCRKFNISESIDEKVRLTNKDGNVDYLFNFKRNKLKRIRAELDID